MRGVNPRNLCNRGRQGRGIQLELSQILRMRLLVPGRDGRRWRPTPLFHVFVKAVGTTLANPKD